MMEDCRECGVELVAGDNWYKSYVKQGNYICKPCKLAANKAWCEKNPDYFRNYYAENRERRKAEARQWNAENKERKRQCSRRYYREHREEMLAANRRWSKENPERIRLINQRYRDSHREDVRRWARARYAADPQAGRAKVHRYRARKAGVETEAVDETVIYERDGYGCVYCGDDSDLTLDHIVPLNSNGPHTEDNLVVACRSCNSSKSDKPLVVWMLDKVLEHDARMAHV